MDGLSKHVARTGRRWRPARPICYPPHWVSIPRSAQRPSTRFARVAARSMPPGGRSWSRRRSSNPSSSIAVVTPSRPLDDVVDLGVDAVRFRPPMWWAGWNSSLAPIGQTRLVLRHPELIGMGRSLGAVDAGHRAATRMGKLADAMSPAARDPSTMDTTAEYWDSERATFEDELNAFRERTAFQALDVVASDVPRERGSRVRLRSRSAEPHRPKAAPLVRRTRRVITLAKDGERKRVRS
jgi:hypothetical protein